MIGLEKGVVRLLPHQAGWVTLFAEEKARLQAVIGAHVLDIQHVGSTSIPGIPAKPIIDIGVGVRNFEEATVCIPLLEQIGYVYRGENGIPRRHYFRRGDPRTHHLHMNEINSADWQNHLLFRDFLRAHADVAQAYGDLKLELAAKFPKDRESYVASKASFIKDVLHFGQSSK